MLAFYSPDGRFDDLFTSNYVTLNVLDQLKRLPGTTNVQIFGAKDYAMRIWLQARPPGAAQADAERRRSRAVNEQNAQFAAGKVGQAPIDQRAGPRLHDHHARPLLRSEGVREDHRPREPRRLDRCGCPTSRASSSGSKDYDFIGRYNGKPATLVGIFLQPGANALEVAQDGQARR